MPCKKSVWKIAQKEMKHGKSPKQAFAVAYSELEHKNKRRK